MLSWMTTETVVEVKTGVKKTGVKNTEVKTGAARAAAASERAKAARGGRTAATPWGGARVLEEAVVAQRAGEKRFSTVFQLLESHDGDQLVRIAYTTDGVARRGPVTLRAQDLKRLHAALERRPALATALGLKAGGA
jgi:hypothetical protein